MLPQNRFADAGVPLMGAGEEGVCEWGGGEGETSAKKSTSSPPGRYFHETVFNLKCIRLKSICHPDYSLVMMAGRSV